MPESIIKALERYLTPQINEIKGELKAINTRIDELDKRMNVRFDAVNEKMDTNIKRIEDKIDALDDKIDYKINALDDKIDIMNKYNERLFSLIHAGQK